MTRQRREAQAAAGHAGSREIDLQRAGIDGEIGLVTGGHAEQGDGNDEALAREASTSS